MSAAAACSSSTIKYDVFISFNGKDNCSNFISNLHISLCQNIIETHRLQKGDEISESLIQAIQDSSISVVVFSKKYASSKCCLDELLQILHCRKYMGQIVIPVFYKVPPSHVRKQTESYKEAFAKYERDFIHNQDKVKKWRDALFETANLAGWDYQTSRDESELIQNITNDVIQKLNLCHPNAFDGLVGIDERCECIELMLRKAPIIGIWGMGGIGKTTLARVVYEKICSQYDSCCFLGNLSKSVKHGLEYIRDKLFFELLKGKNISTEVEGSTFVKRRLSDKKVLIVLDDVNSSKLLEYLVRECSFLGLGSKAIITTRDRDLLIGRVNEIYEVKALNYQASLKLFNIKAFGNERSNKGYEELSKKVVNLAGGLPLALRIYGSILRSRTQEEWELDLKEFEISIPKEILDVLKLSFDGLDYEKKEMFLDIACFFKGETEEHVITLFDGFGFDAIIGLRTLVDRAFITIENNIVRMPDFIQKMGWKITYEESIFEDSIIVPERRRRLWDPKDVCYVLNNNKGTNAVKGIILDLSQTRDVCLMMPDTFKKMPNLRILKFYYTSSNKTSNVKLPSGLESLPDNLIYFRWDGYPLMSLPSMFCGKKLVELHMEGSHVKFLWNGVQELPNLTSMNLHGCKNLTFLPEFGGIPNLKRLDLEGCTALLQLHQSVSICTKLKFLNLRNCISLISLPNSLFRLTSLEFLNLAGCSKLAQCLNFDNWRSSLEVKVYNLFHFYGKKN